MNPDATWPPSVGVLLPRAAEAYAAPEKLAWILSNEGHGREWAHVLHIGPDDTAHFWQAVLRAGVGARIFRVNDREPHGIGCAIESIVTVGRRTAPARIAWHYKDALDVPRLVTTYPRI